MSGPRALVHRDDAEGGRGIQRGQLGPLPLFGCQPVTGGRPHQVVRIAGQRLLGGEAVRVGQTGCEPAQRGRGGCRVDVDPGQVRGPVSDGSVHVGGAGGARSGQPDSSQPCPHIAPSGWARA